MKKLLTLCMALFCCFVVVGCQSSSKDDAKQDQETGTVNGTDAEFASATELLTAIWDTYEEGDRFAAMGGDFNHIVENAPGNFDVADVESLTSVLVLPQELATQVDDAASLVHAMNANTFTSGAFHVSDAKNVENFITVYKDAILNNQWMCGFPEKLYIFQIKENYVVSVFGNGELMKLYEEKLTNVFPSAQLVVEESF